MSERCTAKSKRTHERCRAQPIRGRATCRHHGGRSLAGPLSPSYTSGIYSKYLPARFDEFFKALDGQDSLDLTGKIKVLEARLLDVMARVDTGESGAQWKQLAAVWQRAQAAKAAHNLTVMAEALNELGQLITQGAADWGAWEKIEELIVKQTKVVESQRKRAVEAHRMMSTDEVLGMMRYLAESVKRHVRDPEAIASISADFARFSSAGSLGVAEATESVN